MTQSRARKATLIVLLVASLTVLVAVAIILLPILTHQSAGGSGQQLPDSFVSEAEATGADGRTRELNASTSDGKPADLAAIESGEIIVVTGSGFDSGIGIYVSICAIPESADQKPFPCLGGIPEGAEAGDAQGETALSSAWITDDWAWKAFATHGFDDAATGSFSVKLTVPPAEQQGLDCGVTRCAITTRADHTAGSDRVQDMQLPIAFK